MFEKMNAIFTPEFIEANKDVSSIETLWEKVIAIDSTVTREEFEKYLENIKVVGAEDELDEANLDEVAGGFAVAVCISCVTLGTLIGEAIYYWKKSRK